MSDADVEDAGNSVKLQDPEETIKPEVNIHQIPDLIWSLYGLKASEIKELPSYDDLNFFFCAETDTCNNVNISHVNHDGYVLKVLNSLQSSSPQIIDAQNALCAHVRARGIPTQIPVLNKNGNEYSLETFTVRDGKTCGPCLVRLVTFIPGTIFYNTPYVPGSFYNVGNFVGRLHNAIAQDFHHNFYDTYQTIWSLTEVTSLRNFFHAVNDPRDLEVVKSTVDAFESDVLPNFEAFQKGVIHGDINEQNLIMCEVPDQNDVLRGRRIHDVAALLDFADVTKSYFVFDVAIAITYLSIECEEAGQLDVGGHFIAGYTVHRKLNDVEMTSLKVLICSRLCQSLVYGAHAYAQQPGNEYLLTTSKRGWPLLHKIWRTDLGELLAKWQSIISDYLQR